MFWPFWAEVATNCLDHMATQLVHLTVDGTNIWRKKTYFSKIRFPHLACLPSREESFSSQKAAFKSMKRIPWKSTQPKQFVTGLFRMIHVSLRYQGSSWVSRLVDDMDFLGIMDPLKMYFLLTMVRFHCYASLPEGSFGIFERLAVSRSQSSSSQRPR